MGAAFALWSAANLGHVSPVSAAIKSSFPHLGGSPIIIANKPIMAVTLLVLLVWAGADRWVRKQGWAHYGAAVYALWGAVLLHVLYASLFIRERDLGSWHFVMYVPLLLAAFCLIYQWLAEVVMATGATGAGLMKPVAVGVLVVLVLAANTRDAAFFLQPDRWFPRESYRAAMWCNHHLPVTARIGMTDCGAMGYFCERPVVNLDGLINDYEYYGYLMSGRVADYLRKERIDFLAVHHMSLEKPPDRIGLHILQGAPYKVPPFRMFGPEVVRLLSEQTQVYHGRPYWDGPSRAVCVVWDIGALQNPSRWSRQ
jgi:hypothetical protein